jgi:hypothetical protein
VYKERTVYEKKLNDLKAKERELETEQQNLSMGKQGLLDSLLKRDMADSKKKLDK